MSEPSEFWNPEHFDYSDSLNQDIWERSPDVQREIQSVEELQQPDAIGAQQAMLPDVVLAGRKQRPLPWVPDLVGTNWCAANSVIVVGSAYAGFIREYSKRSGKKEQPERTMPLADYLAVAAAEVLSPERFQRRFLESVVIDDGNYYSPIAHLCGVLGDASHIVLLDLCRASFVERRAERAEGGLMRRADSSRSSIYTANPAGAKIFEKYVESETPRNWLWQRLNGGKARFIVALGFTAEHGLLRLFAERGITVTEGDRVVSLSSLPKPWPMRYADDDKKLRVWRDSGTWLTATEERDGSQREWHILPVFHPSSHDDPRNDPDYKVGRRNLDKMLNAVAGGWKPLTTPPSESRARKGQHELS